MSLEIRVQWRVFDHWNILLSKEKDYKTFLRNHQSVWELPHTDISMREMLSCG